MQYRRSTIQGASYFFTANIQNRRLSLLTQHIKTLRHVLSNLKRSHPFHINAAVIMPNHLHMIWTLPEGDNDYSLRWGLLKSAFSRNIKSTEKISTSRKNKGERGIWQRRFWEHLIRDEKDFENHVNYIHYNPVKHGYVKSAIEWPYSSIHRYIRQGVLKPDWAGGEKIQGEFGE